MKLLDKIFNKNNEDNKKENKTEVFVIYENDKIENEINEWVKYLERDSISDILLEIGFKNGDTVYLYSKGLSYTEFYYSVNEDKKNIENTIQISYGAFKNRGSMITIENENKMMSYAVNNNNKFSLDVEKIYVSDVMEYTRHYYANSSIMWFNSNVDDKDYILKLSIFKNLNEDDILKLDNEIELEKYLCSLSLPCNLIDVFKKICEISKIDLNQYDSFSLSLHKKNKRYQQESEVISHIDFMHGEFRSLSYIKEGKKINYKSSGDWSYEMIDEDDLVKLSINVKGDKVDCKINSNSESELDDYFKDLVVYDMGLVKSEINNVKRLVKSNFNS